MSSEFPPSFTFKTQSISISPLPSSPNLHCPTASNSSKGCSLHGSTTEIKETSPSFHQSKSQTTLVADGKIHDIMTRLLSARRTGFPTGISYGPELTHGSTGTSASMARVSSVVTQSVTPSMCRLSIARDFAYELSTKCHGTWF